MNTVTVRLFVLVLLCTVLMPAHSKAASSREWHFEVFLDDEPIGFHHFHLNSTGNTHELHAEASFRVTLLGFTVYDYTHKITELWQQDCLQRIDASTDDNGTELFVRGNSKGDQLALQNNTGNSELPGCVMTFAYWNPAILERQQLLNTQTGEYLNVKVQHLGKQPLQTEGRDIPALHYRISSRERDIDLWYSTELDWLALSSTTSGGRQLHYRRLATPFDTQESTDG